MGKGEIDKLLYDRDNHKLFTFTAIIVPYFAITEFLPSIVVASTLLKFSKVMEPLNDEGV